MFESRDATYYHHKACLASALFFLTPPPLFVSSGEAFDCGRHISSLSRTSASRRGDVSPVIYFNK